MWVYAVAIFMTGVTFFFMPFQPPPNPEHTSVGRNQVLAQEFLMYRAMTKRFFEANPGHEGEIPQIDIPWPDTMNFSGTWSNRVVSGIIYVYGPNFAGLLKTIAESTHSTGIGINSGGILHYSNRDTLGMAVPTFIPDKNIVSVVEG
jgi:hypothetical protein